MNRILIILFLSVLASSAMAQAPTKEVDIISKNTKKLNFSEIKIESEAEDEFKTLEIRYEKLENASQESLKVESVEYKCFPDKKSAVKYYYLIKKASPQKVIYYVYSMETKKPEIFTFRILQ